MPTEETVEVAPSADNGNIPVDAPIEQPKPVTPPVEEPVKTAEPKQELYELPDGRKVDAVTLTKEWKENFLPDYTRKSQALAAKDKAPITTKTPEVDPYEAPDYTPKSYGELIRIAEERAEQRVFKSLEEREKKSAEERQALENEVTSQLNDVKKADPSVNENLLFQHATKYGFRDLRVAHQNMKDMAALAKNIQQTTVKNIQKREDPVSTANGKANGTRPDPSMFSNARDYLRSLKN